MKKLLLILLLLLPSLAWGAFPETSVLSSFDIGGTDETPLSEGGLWTWDIRLEASPAAKISGNLTGSTSNYWNATWASQTFGPECEVYATIATYAGDPIILILKLHEGTGGLNFYYVYFSPESTTNYIGIAQDGILTDLDGPWSLTLASGDSIGFAYSAGNLIVYRKPAAGSWTAERTLAETTYQNVSGKIAIDSGFTTQTFDDFGGGTVGTPATVTVRHRPVIQ